MKYIQADIHVNREGIEPVLTALMNVDIMDTVVEDPAGQMVLVQKLCQGKKQGCMDIDTLRYAAPFQELFFLSL